MKDELLTIFSMIEKQSELYLDRLYSDYECVNQVGSVTVDKQKKEVQELLNRIEKYTKNNM